ncbi:hypothetical protein [Streptomyces sp. NPDC006645]
MGDQITLAYKGLDQLPAWLLVVAAVVVAVVIASLAFKKNR